MRSSPANVVTALLSVALTVGCSDQPALGPIVGNWTTSNDGVLSIRLRAPRAAFDAPEAFVIFVDLRNDSEETVNILLPFVDDYRAYCRITMYGPSGQKVEYTGPTPDYIISGPLFSSLEPGAVIQGQLELRVEDFDGSEAVGDYTIEYEYWVHESDRIQAQQDGFDTFWMGRLNTQLIRAKKVT